MAELRFDGAVAIVTGAGRNLGREYALLLAERGARVVVNDLGVGISDTDGVADAPEVNPADEVVAEIAAAGGEAVASYDSIATAEGGAAIVQTALDAFGGVDIVVNNAGRVRMMPFAAFTDDHIVTVVETQLEGVLNVSRPAWAHMAEHGGGRFVNVSSGAALSGVPGGSVYGMAKMGVVGLTRAMAAEGAPLDITANVIAPYAKTRPGSGFGPIPWSPELQEWLHPRLVAPLVGWLAHPDCPARGECFTVGAGHIARVELVLHEGLFDRNATIDTLAARADEVMGGATSPITAFGSRAIELMMGAFDGPT
ncbi:MAG: SDR family NAD(P)-dependent oxidoreductase [Acidimicrobiales bacterium]|nr:SDR family NAD(P)-dependent oxidoreductase [Acidimicrobiales bacterium]